MSLHSQELAPHGPRFPLICLFAWVFSSVVLGEEPWGLEALPRCPAERGRASRRCVQSSTCVHRRVCTRCRFHPSGSYSTPSPAVRHPRTHFPRRKPQILIPQPLARPIGVPHNCLGFSLLPLRPPGLGSSLPWGPHSASSLVSCPSPHPFTPHPAARTFLVSFFVTLRGMWDQTHAPRSGSMES